MKHLKKFEGCWLSDEWLKPEEVKPGMIGINSNDGKNYSVVEIHSTKYLKEHPEVFFNMLKQIEEFGSVNMYRESDLPMLAYGYIVLAIRHTDPARMQFLWYDGVGMNTHDFKVPATERWKGSDKLAHSNDKTGVFEHKHVEEWLHPDEVKPGMVGIGDGKQYPVIEIHSTEYLKKHPDVFYNMLKKQTKFGSFNLFQKDDLPHLSNGYLVLIVKPNDTMKIIWYDYNDGPELFNDFKVPASERWKGSNTLAPLNDKTGVFENVKTEWLQPEEVVPGMRCYFGDEEPSDASLVPLTVIGVYNTEFFIKNPKEYEKVVSQLSTNNPYRKEKPKDLARDSWLVFYQMDAVKCGGKKMMNWYTDDFENPAVNSLRVPASEKWKQSKILQDINNKMGVFENVEEMWLDADMVSVGMLGHYQPYDGELDKHVEVLDIVCLRDLSWEEFKKWQTYTPNNWLTYPFKIYEAESNFIKNSNHPSDDVEYAPDWDKPFKSVIEFVKGNAFYPDLTIDDYIVKIKSKYDILGTEVFGGIPSNRITQIDVVAYKENKETDLYFKVPVSEFYKKSKQLKNVNKATGVFENITGDAGEFLSPEDLVIGMIGYDFQKEESTIVEIYTPDEATANWREIIKKSGSGWLNSIMKQEMIDDHGIPENAYFVLVKGDFAGLEGGSTYNFKYEVYPYGYDTDGSFTFGVPVEELWKKHGSDKLKDLSKQSGVLEKVIIEKKSWHFEEGVLDAADVVPGMIGYDMYNGIYVEIIRCYKISDLDKETFKKLQSTSISKWLSFKFDTTSNMDGTRDSFEIDKDASLKNVDEFLKYNSFQHDLKKSDYLMVVKTTKDINGNSDYDREHRIKKFYEVLPYVSDWLEVSVKEAWKKSKSLIDMNDKTGVFESREKHFSWFDDVTFGEKILKGEDIVPGMIGETSNENNECKVIDVCRISNMTEEHFKDWQNQVTGSSNWIICSYNEDDDGHWRIDRNKMYKSFKDFKNNNPFRDLWKYENYYLVLVLTMCDFLGNCNVAPSEPFLEVFLYNGYDFSIPLSELWKKNKKLKDVNDTTGVFEKRILRFNK